MPDSPFVLEPLDLLDALPDLVCWFDPAGILRYVNASYADYYGMTADELVGRCFLDLIPVGFETSAAENLRALSDLRVENPKRIDVHQGGDSGGRVRWFQWTNRAQFVDGREQPIAFISIGRDITDQRRAEERSRYLATHDSLTGLCNRHALRTALGAQLQRARVTGMGFGLIFVDVDRLKQVNDQHGHAAGDDVLRLTARSLSRSFRSTDLVARVGGDEFVVVCPDVDDAAVLDRMLHQARRHLTSCGPGSGDAGVGISAGVVICRPGMDVDEALKAADTVMYLDKDRRRPADVVS